MHCLNDDAPALILTVIGRLQCVRLGWRLIVAGEWLQSSGVVRAAGIWSTLWSDELIPPRIDEARLQSKRGLAISGFICTPKVPDPRIRILMGQAAPKGIRMGVNNSPQSVT